MVAKYNTGIISPCMKTPLCCSPMLHLYLYTLGSNINFYVITTDKTKEYHYLKYITNEEQRRIQHATKYFIFFIQSWQ